ncbi:hypothetical protein STEG23_030191 [Scotinomys teguina]
MHGLAYTLHNSTKQDRVFSESTTALQYYDKMDSTKMKTDPGPKDSIHVAEIGIVSKLVSLEGPEGDMLRNLDVVEAGGASDCDTRRLTRSYPADVTNV